MTKAWLSGLSFPRDETSNSPSRLILQVGQAIRVTPSGALQSGHSALEMSIDDQLNISIVHHKLHIVKYRLKFIDSTSKVEEGSLDTPSLLPSGSRRR